MDHLLSDVMDTSLPSSHVYASLHAQTLLCSRVCPMHRSRYSVKCDRRDHHQIPSRCQVITSGNPLPGISKSPPPNSEQFTPCPELALQYYCQHRTPVCYRCKMPPKKIGQELGQVRSNLPLDKLVPYLEKHVDGYRGPLEVQQFKFGQVSVVFMRARLCPGLEYQPRVCYFS